MKKTNILCLAMMILPVMAACSSKSSPKAVDASTSVDGSKTSIDAPKGTSVDAPTTTTVDAAKGAEAAAAVDGSSTTAPPPPTLGTQIDRVGRPAINAALTDPFGLTGGTATASESASDVAKDTYNSASDPTMWVSTFSGPIATNLAIFAGLSVVLSAADACADQIAAGPTAVAGRYSALASVLADDRLWVNTSNMGTVDGTATGMANCTYLAVEGTGLKLLPLPTDCGGRTLQQDVVAETYTLLTVGLKGFMNGAFTVNSGITAWGGGTGSNSGATESSVTFPFLATPN